MSETDPRLRIADSDRERAMADLAMHYADGRLDHEEYDERLDAIWTARTRADLAVLFSDLPRQQAAAAPVRARRPSNGRPFKLPLLPVLALLVALSVLTGAPVWLLVFPLMFFSGRHRGGCGPVRGHADYRRADYRRADYRRPGRSTGW